MILAACFLVTAGNMAWSVFQAGLGLCRLLQRYPTRAKTESEVIKGLLDPWKYDPASRPLEANNTISVAMFVKTIRSVDLKKGELTLQIILR